MPDNVGQLTGGNQPIPLTENGCQWNRFRTLILLFQQIVRLRTKFHFTGIIIIELDCCLRWWRDARGWAAPAVGTSHRVCLAWKMVSGVIRIARLALRLGPSRERTRLPSVSNSVASPTYAARPGAQSKVLRAYMPCSRAVSESVAVFAHN